MGRGSYTASDWAKLRTKRNLNDQQCVEKIFSVQTAITSYSSKSIHLRCSCDPEADAKATPVIIGFDVTASMGYLAKELATNGMHTTIMRLLADKQITDPQILCAAIGDCKSDVTPLQVTQFEADIRILEQLLNLHLEGGGGGNNGESYNLLWYFAAYHTRHDHFEKRGKKGYLFTIGDDYCHSKLTTAEIGRNFTSSSMYELANEELLQRVQKKYHVFHIHIDKGLPMDNDIFRQWVQLLPGHCAPISKKDIVCLPELVTAMIAVTEGKTINEALRGMDQKRAERIARSVAEIKRTKKTNAISF